MKRQWENEELVEHWMLDIEDRTLLGNKTGATRFHARGSRIQDLVAIVKDAGFDQLEREEMRPSRFSAFPGAGFVRAHKS